jgi:hypothetical protein
VRGGDSEVARDRELRTAAQSISIEPGDDRDGELGYAVERRAHAMRHRSSVRLRAHLPELLDVATGAEGLIPSAADDENARSFAPHGLKGLVELSHGLQRKGVAGAWPIDGQCGHATDDLEPEVWQRLS